LSRFGTVVGVLSGRVRVYYGWKVLAASIAAMAFASGLSMVAFGLYVSPLEDEFGWSRAEVSFGFSASVLSSGLAGPLIGAWIDSRGARSAILIGAVLTALSYVLLASTQTLWQFYLFYAIHAVCRQMMFFIPFQTLISTWFVRRRGVALSILGSGFSLGGFAVLPILALVIEQFGWRASYLLSGALIAAYFLPVTLLVIRNRPSDVGEQVDGGDLGTEQAPGPESQTSEGPSVTLRQALRMPLFWILSLGFMFLFFGMIGWLVHQIPFYESKGISRAGAALIVALSAGASVVVRIGMGLVADRIQRFEVAVVALLAMLMGAMGILLVSTSLPALALFLTFWVVGASAGPMIESLVLIKAFGMRYFGSILGACLVVETLGQIVSPSLAGVIYDRSGSYDGALVMFMGSFGAGLLLFLIAARMRPPALQDTPAKAPALAAVP
jgi:sugar phosphate permease